MTIIDLIRHGQTTWNREQRFQGHYDAPLSEEGHQQAKRLVKYALENKSISSIYSSDLSRAMQTAQRIAEALKLTVVPMEQFRERNMGEWAGLTFAEVKEKYPDWEQVRIHGGAYQIEKTEDMVNRVLHELEKLATKHPGEHICVVSHGGCISAVLRRIAEGENLLGKFSIQNTSITRLKYDPANGWQVVFHNQITHLEGDET
jgi:broad specificity phosphatase PhoE